MKTLLLLLGIGISAIANAQQTAARLNLKFSPLSLLDPDATVQGAVEIRLKKHYSLQAEFGYGNDRTKYAGFGPSPWTSNAHVAGKETWRTRLEGRYYIPYSPTHPHRSLYIAVEGLYKQVNGTHLDTLLAHETVDPIFVYAPVTRYVYALHNKIGTHVFLSHEPNSLLSHFFIDFYTGLGVRYINVVSKSPETDRLFQNNVIYDRFAASPYRSGNAFWRLSISLGFKIGVSL